MAAVMVIDFEEAKNRFMIRCPAWMNDQIRALPNRRWVGGQKAWAAPAIRRNVEAIRSWLTFNNVTFTPTAHRAISESVDVVVDVPTRPFPTWYKFKTDPMEHQTTALKKAYGKHCFAMFAEQGTGKSKWAIDLVSAMRMENELWGVLVVCKLSLRKNWVLELEKHCPIAYQPHLPYTEKKKDYQKWLHEKPDFPWMIVGTESLSAGRMIEICEAYLCAGLKMMVIVDESSMIANHKATRSENVVRLGRRAETRIAMTGTPMSTGPMNLFMQFEFLDPDIIGIGDFYSFRNRYATMGGFENKQIIGYQHLDELTSIIAPYTYQALKKDVMADLPPKLYEVRTVEMTTEQRALYRAMKKGNLELVPQNVLEEALRMSQIVGGFIAKPVPPEKILKKTDPKFYTESIFSDWDENPKMRELVDIIEESGPDDAFIIWAAYADEIRMIISMIEEKYGEVAHQLHGGIEQEYRQDEVNDFQSGKCSRFVVGNAAVGGMGYTMTRCTTMVYFSNTQLLIDRQQSEDRAHRKGLVHPVRIIDLIVDKSTDVLIKKSLNNKQNLTDYVRGLIDAKVRGVDIFELSL